jgi:N utilization substance protein B
MAMPRDIRRLALVVLYQLDARGEGDFAQIRESIEETIARSTGEATRDDEGTLFIDPEDAFSEGEKARACDLAGEAFAARAAADAEFEALAPDWPPRRQAAIDRAILRLAHFEMVSGRTPPKVAVNEAVELAKAFSTDRSPAFINGLLGRVLKRVLGSAEPAPTLDEGEHGEVTPLHLGGAAGHEASGS